MRYLAIVLTLVALSSTPAFAEPVLLWDPSYQVQGGGGGTFVNELGQVAFTVRDSYLERSTLYVTDGAGALAFAAYAPYAGLRGQVGFVSLDGTGLLTYLYQAPYDPSEHFTQGVFGFSTPPPIETLTTWVDPGPNAIVGDYFTYAAPSPAGSYALYRDMHSTPEPSTLVFLCTGLIVGILISRRTSCGLSQ